MSLGTLVVELTANVAKFQSDLGRAEQIAQNTARKIDAQFGIVKNALATFSVGLASFASFDALAKKIDGVIASAAGLQQLSERTGATVENLSALASVAKLSGTDTEQLAGGLQKLSRAMLDAQQGGTKTSAAFSAVGISTKDLASQRPDEVFIRLATELAKYQDGAGKTALAQELLGKSGANLLPVMKDLAEVGDLQVKVTSEQAQMADEYEKNLVRLKASTDAIFKKIGLELVPVLNAFTKAILESQNANDGLKASVDSLAKDGSIRDWAERAAIGVSYFIDVASVVPDILNIVGKTIGAAAAQFMGLIEVAKGAGQALSGDFSKGVQTAQAGLAQIKGVGDLWVKDMQEIWNRPLFSDRLKKQLEEARKAGTATPRPVLPNLNLGGDNELLKKQLDGQLRLLERQIQEEQRLYQVREQLLAQFYGDDLVSIADYYAARQNAADEYLRNTQALYDKEIAALKAYQAQITDAKAKLDAQNRIEDVQERSRQLAINAQTKSVFLNLEQAKATRAYNDEVERLNIRLLELQGNLAEAGKRQTALQDRQLRKRLTVEDNTQGLAVLDQLEKIENARSSMSELNLKSSIIEERLGATEARVSAQRQTGAITELESMAKLSAARSQAVLQLTEVANQMEAVAKASGDPRMLTNVEAFKAKIEQLAASSDVLGTKFRLIFEDNLSNFFTDLISGAKSFKTAFLDMARGIEQAISRIVAQNLAQSLFGATGIFGGTSGGLGNIVGGFIGSIFGGGSMPGAAGSSAAVAGTGLKLPANAWSLPGRAKGGDVSSNQPYLVGEHGPEVFVPRGSGFIVANDRLDGLAKLSKLADKATRIGNPATYGWALPGRANGGDVFPNQAYMVGERGPEVFVPDSAGSIVPNDRLGGTASGGRSGNSSIVINNHFAPGTDLRTIDQAANLIGLRVQRAMRRTA
jgi:hypothetical protein